jgi:DNA-binding transcriptional ArsR family regulator
MPAPVSDIVAPARIDRIMIGPEPAHNCVHSLFLLTMAEQLSGLNDWVVRTFDKLSIDERQRNALVTIGLHYAVVPDRSWSSFPAYVEHLAAMNPVELRDKLLKTYARMPGRGKKDHFLLDEGSVTLDVDAWLESPEAFLLALRQRFDEPHVHPEIEAEAYTYLIDPPAMQTLIVDHLRKMWEEYLAIEWARKEPILMDAVRAFREADFTQMSNLEAARFITGQPLEDEGWQAWLERAERLVFVPSPHAGPYLGRFPTGHVVWVLFGARLPSGTSLPTHELSRAAIIVRLSALTDDTRLQILRMVADSGEVRSQEVIDRLGISQSAASRHLKQLSATGYLAERRCDGGKCYQLSRGGIEETLAAVSRFLLGE